MATAFLKRIKKPAFFFILFFILTACGGSSDSSNTDTQTPAAQVPAEIEEAVRAAEDIEQTFPVQFASDSSQGIRSRLSAAFPRYPDLLSGGEDAKQYLRNSFTGTPGFEEDIKFVIYALALEELNDTASISTLQTFLHNNINGDLNWASHFITHAIKTLLGDSDLEISGYYSGEQMQAAAAVSSVQAFSYTRSQTADDQRPSCRRQYVLVDAQGNPLTYVDGNGHTRDAVVYGTEFSTSQIPQEIHDYYTEQVRTGGGTYVNDDSMFPGTPSKQFNCAGYAFRNFNNGNRWTSDPSLMFDVLTRTGALVEVDESQAQPGDKVFYFAEGQALPGHVAEVKQIESGLVFDSIVVRNADGQSGLWEAKINASYFTGNAFGWEARYPQRKVLRWKNNTPPRLIPDPNVENNPVYCSDDSAGEGDALLTATIRIPDYYTTTFNTDNAKAAALLSKITDSINKVELDNIPTVLGYTGNDPADFIDEIVVSLNPSLPGPGTYTSVGDMFDLLDGTQAGIILFTDEIRHADSMSSRVPFYAVSGSVVVENFGTNVGDRISGTFDVTIQGEQDVCNDEDCEDVPVLITGTIEGRFDGIIASEQNAQ
ncbi:MAG: hypothetical protein ABIK15_00010 [Pseudomonadota bacterium]